MEVEDLSHLENCSNKLIFGEILLGILRYAPVKEMYDNAKYREELQLKLRTNHIDDSEVLRVCIDLLEDTEYAILSYKKDGLEYQDTDIGKVYLRLYGILNAIYLQMQAIIELCEIFKIKNKGVFVSNLRGLKIYDIRNKIGSHTTNYLIDKGKKPSRENCNFYKVSMGSLSNWEHNIMIVPVKGKVEEVDLFKLISEYTDYADKILYEICDKSIYSIFKNNSKHRDWLVRRLLFIKDIIQT